MSTSGPVESLLSATDLGARLRRSREARGITSGQAAERLHCDAFVIQNLESGRFEELGPAVFVRGHLRRYGDFLGENGTELAGLWAQPLSDVTRPDLTRIAQAPRRVDTRRWRLLAASAGVALALGVAVWWVLRSDAPIALTTDSKAAEAVPVAATAMDALPSTPAATAPGLAVSVTLLMSDDCWTEIYDAGGKALYFNRVRAGGRVTVGGPAPLRVLLGRYRAATLSVAGRAIEVPADAVRAGDAAVILIDAAGRVAAAPRS